MHVHAVHWDYCIICKKRGTSTDTFLKSRKFPKDNGKSPCFLLEIEPPKNDKKARIYKFQEYCQTKSQVCETLKLHVLKSDHLQCTYIIWICPHCPVLEKVKFGIKSMPFLHLNSSSLSLALMVMNAAVAVAMTPWRPNPTAWPIWPASSGAIRAAAAWLTYS